MLKKLFVIIFGLLLSFTSMNTVTNYANAQDFTQNSVLYDKMHTLIKNMVEKNAETNFHKEKYSEKILNLLNTVSSKIPLDKKMIFDHILQVTIDLNNEYKTQSILDEQKRQYEQTQMNTEQEYQVDKAVEYANNIFSIEEKSFWGVQEFISSLYGYEVTIYSDISMLWKAYNDAYRGVKYVVDQLKNIGCFEGDCDYITAKRNAWNTMLSMYDNEFKQFIQILDDTEKQMLKDKEAGTLRYNFLGLESIFSETQQKQIDVINESIEKKQGRIQGEAVKMNDFANKHGFYFLDY